MKPPARFAGAALAGWLLLGAWCLFGPGAGDALADTARLKSLQPGDAILFTSNRDTGNTRHEIYALNTVTASARRLTFTESHHFIMAVDSHRRYLLSAIADQDTAAPAGLGDEDRRALWMLDFETGQENRLTDPTCHAEGDAFSPDGAWIVFFMKTSDTALGDIYKIKTNGTQLTRLTNTPEILEGDPAWAPNGWIVFTALNTTDPAPRFVLKRMDADGGQVSVVYDGGPSAFTPTAWPDGNYDPSVSPDSQWVVFERAVDASNGNFGSGVWHLFKVRMDGSGLVDLSDASGQTASADFLPSFSPDGRDMVFGSLYQAPVLADSYADIFVMDSAGGAARRLTDHPATDMMPVWIPAAPSATATPTAICTATPTPRMAAGSAAVILFPNPATERVDFRFGQAAGAEVEICIFNAGGERVARIAGLAADHPALSWNGPSAAGVYYYIIRSGNQPIQRGRFAVVRD